MLSKYETRSHFEVVSSHIKALHRIVGDGRLEVDGNSLTLASVVAVSKYV